MPRKGPLPKFDQLAEILVPIPPDGDYDLFIDEVEQAQAEIKTLEDALQEKRTKLRGKFVSLYEGTEESEA